MTNMQHFFYNIVHLHYVTVRRRLFSTAVGYSEQLMLRAYLAVGIREGDRILLIRSEKEDDQARRAEHNFRTLIEGLRPGIDIESVSMDPMDFEGNTVKLVRLYAEAKKSGYSIVVNPIAGLRALGLVQILALTFVGGQATIHLETGGSVELVNIPSFTPRIREERIRVLMAVGRDKGPKQVAEEQNITLPTVYRHLKSLRGEGLLDGSGRLTILGRGLIELYRCGLISPAARKSNHVN